MDDILAQFRRTSATQGKPSADTVEPEKYVAFGTRDKVIAMRIVIEPELDHSPAYPTINVISDGNKGTVFVAVYPSIAFLVRGRNLQKVVFAVRNRMAEFIQKFDERYWAKPTDPAAPIIDFIEVHAKDGASETI